MGRKMTLKTRLKKIEASVNKSIDGNPMPTQVIVAEYDEDIENKINELKQKYGEESYSKGTVMIIRRSEKENQGVL